jgi:bleomycin hydrolase
MNITKMAYNFREETQKNTHNTQSIKPDYLNKLKRKFYEDKTNIIIQNSLCANQLEQVSEVREYMQSRDSNFSHTLDPELVVSNQGLSGRCWMFAVLNVMRHELVRKYRLPHDFELSESYLCFYEKLEKCNYFLTRFLTITKEQMNDRSVIQLLHSGSEDGGQWITCANLIKKYGIIPKSCYKESANSFRTSDMNTLLNYKLRECAMEMINETEKSKRFILKENMLKNIYNLLIKLLGTPPGPNDKFKWSYVLQLELIDDLEREQKRRRLDGKYENFINKHSDEISPLEFYEKYIVNKLDSYMKFSNDPRNVYNKFYKSFDYDIVVEGERNGYFNIEIDKIAKLCINSLTDNTPVEFDCDVGHYMNQTEQLLDPQCYNYEILFNTTFFELNKKNMMICRESMPNHAMVLVGVDLDKHGNPLKWKVENSWGRDLFAQLEGGNDYYTMSHEWFKKYVYNAVVQSKYVDEEITKQYVESCKHKEQLPEFDIMG